MIGVALGVVRRELNAFFRQLLGDSREVVTLSALNGREEGAAADTSNRILFALTHVRQETTLRNQLPSPAARRDGCRYPPISIVLHVVFASNFTDYVTGLDFLADVIAFLQARPVFDHENSPGLDPRLEKLTFSMLNLEYSELNSLWGTLGTDFRPSVFYEVRLLPLPVPRLISSPPSPSVLESPSASRPPSTP
jgi:hypothetical protein